MPAQISYVLAKDVEGSVDKMGRRKYARKWFVRVLDWTLYTPPITWTDIPVNRGDPYVNALGIDTGAIALTIEAKPTGERPGDYWVSVVYGSEDLEHVRGSTGGSPQRADQSTSPDQRPLVIDFTSTHSTAPLGPLDLMGNTIQNAAKSPVTGLEQQVSNNVIKWTKYVSFTSGFDPVAKQLTYVNKINLIGLNIPNVSIANFAKGALRCNEFDSDITFENNSPWWKCTVTTELEGRYGQWQPLILNAGLFQIKSLSVPPVPILDPTTGQPITTPVPLDSGGLPLAANATPYYIVINPTTNVVGFKQNPTIGTDFSYYGYLYADFTQFFN